MLLFLTKNMQLSFKALLKPVDSRRYCKE